MHVNLPSKLTRNSNRVLKLLPVLDRSAIAVEAEVAQAQGSLVEEEAFDRAAADDFALEQWCAMRPEQLTVALHATLRADSEISAL